MEWTEKTGAPFSGSDKERLVEFLKKQNLEYDEGITWSILLEVDGEVAATGSVHGNVLKCIAVSEEYRGQNLLGTLMTRLVTCLVNRGITRYFVFTRPANQRLFESLGMYPVAATDQVLLLENRKNGVDRYIAELKKESALAKAGPVGAIVANCNPFTLGHRHLISRAAAECRWVHLFILSEEQSFLRTSERYELVKRNVADIPNVILHRTSDYLISPAVFPTYFLKEKEHSYEINCMLDIQLFGERIAPALGITRRYVGTEPFCQVTGKYNECLKQKLPEFGIQVREIPRAAAETDTEKRQSQRQATVISASAVRQAYAEDRLDQAASMLPEITLAYLKEKRRQENGSHRK